MDNAINLNKVTKRNRDSFGGFYMIGTDRNPLQKMDVAIFNNPYTKVNRDLVCLSGELYVSDVYGETMDRKKILYVVHD